MRQHVRIQNPLYVFWPTALALDVPRHEFAREVFDRVHWRPFGGRFLRLHPWRDRNSGASRVDAAAQEGTRARGLLMGQYKRQCQVFTPDGKKAL